MGITKIPRGSRDPRIVRVERRHVLPSPSVHLSAQVWDPRITRFRRSKPSLADLPFCIRPPLSPNCCRDCEDGSKLRVRAGLLDPATSPMRLFRPWERATDHRVASLADGLSGASDADDNLPPLVRRLHGRAQDLLGIKPGRLLDFSQRETLVRGLRGPLWTPEQRQSTAQHGLVDLTPKGK